MEKSGVGIATINPFRYRGYYYDQETGLYYLQSRYYNPDVARFVNGDDVEIVGSNYYTYCYNSPVNLVDNGGNFGTPIQWVCAAIGGITGLYFGDYIARGLGLAPKGKGWWNATRYWAVRAAVIIGGAAVGWFAGTTVIALAKRFLISKPKLIFNLIRKLGVTALSIAIINSMIKAVLYSAGSAVLSHKKYTISKDAWHHALYGNGKNWSSTKLNNKIKNNSYFIRTLKEVLKGKTSVKNVAVELKLVKSGDNDLYLTLGKINLYATGQKISGKWKLQLKGEDKYNFDYILSDDKLTFGHMANDVGYIMERTRLLKPYKINVSFSVTL